jgi:hypothetical protein
MARIVLISVGVPQALDGEAPNMSERNVVERSPEKAHEDDRTRSHEP